MLNRNCFWLIGVLLLQTCLGCATTYNAEQQQLAERQSLDAQLSLARLSERHGKLDFAKQVYERVLETSPSSTRAHHRMGVIEAQQGRIDKADKHFKAAMKSGRPSVDLLSDYGYALYLKEDLASAERVLRQVVERQPRHTAARNNLALVLGEQGRFNESFQEFRMAVDEPEALANLAYVKTTMGEFEDAQKTYHRALTLKGDMRPAAEALVQLAEVDGVIKSSKSLVDPKPVTPPHPPSLRNNRTVAKPAKPPRTVKNVNRATRLPKSQAKKPQNVQLTTHLDRAPQSKSTARAPGAESTPQASTATRASAARTTPRSGQLKGKRHNATAKRATKTPSPRKPSFFPGSVSPPKQIDRPNPNGTPKASKIETIQPLTAPSFETSFVDDMHTEFPGGNTISSGQSFLDSE